MLGPNMEQPQQYGSAALQTLAARGLLEQMSDASTIDDDLASGMVTFYAGFDPTGPSLHAGHLWGIMAMRLLQKQGHKPIALVGGGTARIGDPSGRSEMRKMLDEPTLDANVAAIGRQFARFLDFDATRPSAAVLIDNAQWLVEKRYIDFLRDVGVHFTVNRMIATKTYRDRLDNELPLSFLEFNYQLLQAYDFLHLYRESSCTVQLGGSDQWGNMIAGVELIRRVGDLAHGPAHCLTWPLLTMADGRKMGKTERGAVWLDPDLLSVFDYYQYWVGCDDRDVRKLLLVFSELPLEEIDALCALEGAALNRAKHRLAFEATALAHGEEEARKAERAAAQAFGGSEDWSAVPAIELSAASVKLLDLVVDEPVKAFGSKRQAKQRIESGAVRVDGEICKDPYRELRGEDFTDRTLRLQAGKKVRFRVVLAS
jgi:tyrosyl-tRNA synthetase